jgi:hypothetical protein
MTIDEVIDRLTDITASARAHGSRLGYFAALYRTVTIEVKRGIENGKFEDGRRMERLDVIFARRYLDAFDAYRAGRPLPRSWRLSFDAAAGWRPIVLQHLLSGISAHINLDLGIAAATVAPGPSLPSLRRDFDVINGILASLVEGVEKEIASVSPWIRLLLLVGGRTDDVLINFNLTIARGVAWAVAEQLSAVDPRDHEPRIAAFDLAASLVGTAVLHPPLLTTLGLLVIRGRELSSVAHVIDVLTSVHPLPVEAPEKTEIAV